MSFLSCVRVWRYLRGLVWASSSKWLDDRCFRYGASLSYYTVLSLAPLLVILVGVIGLFFGRGAAHHQLVGEAVSLAGERAGALVDALLAATRRKTEGAAASLMAVGLLLAGATGVLVELRDAFDHIWMARPASPGKMSFLKAMRDVVLTRMLTFGILFAVGFLMVISLLVSAYLASLQRWVQHYTSDMLHVARVLNPVLSFVLLVFLFTILMLGLPSQRPPWRMVLPGAVLSALLFNAGKGLIGLYLGATFTTSVYGAAGSLVAFMVWVYYSSQIVLFGAEFAWVLHFTPQGELPGSPAYQRMYHAAVAARQRQIRLLEDAAQTHDPSD